jgi:hypothetical protein
MSAALTRKPRATLARFRPGPVTSGRIFTERFSFANNTELCNFWTGASIKSQPCEKITS